MVAPRIDTVNLDSFFATWPCSYLDKQEACSTKLGRPLKEGETSAFDKQPRAEPLP